MCGNCCSSIVLHMSLTPFTDRAKKIAKAMGYKAMQERSDYARSDSWWNNLVNHGPWKGSGESRVFPPSVETIPGIAKLFESTEAEVRAMIAADWYGVDSDAVMTHRVLKFASAIDTLDEADARLILELIPRLNHASLERFINEEL